MRYEAKFLLDTKLVPAVPQQTGERAECDDLEKRAGMRGCLGTGEKIICDGGAGWELGYAHWTERDERGGFVETVGCGYGVEGDKTGCCKGHSGEGIESHWIEGERVCVCGLEDKTECRKRRRRGIGKLD